MKFGNKAKMVLCIAASISLSACNEEGGKSSSSVDGLSSIVGVYDLSKKYSDGTVDEWYLGIDSDGYFSVYDYMGDSYDNYMNCYFIRRNWDKLTHVSGNVFTSEVVGEVTVTKSSSGLTITPENGSAEQLKTGEKVSLTVSDFEAAECSSSNSLPNRTIKSLGHSYK